MKDLEKAETMRKKGNQKGDKTSKDHGSIKKTRIFSIDLKAIYRKTGD